MFLVYAEGFQPFRMINFKNDAIYQNAQFIIIFVNRIPFINRLNFSTRIPSESTRPVFSKGE